ncbi:MAG TPA: hypothetical protein VG841_00385 [Caulobacterales bacterium]|nr:hypothetical protein [Caulobacterales bacterium]
MSELDYQAALDEMYAGYMAKRDRVAGLMDRDFKNPDVILSIARALNLTPAPARTIKITGSKGKGSTSRLIDFYLRRIAPSANVALFVSPEELEHTDRMKLNGRPIGEAEFVDIFRDLRPHLREAAGRLQGDAYLSPFGIFLLIALAWFARRRADWHVLEIGRGGAHDEVGVLPAETAIITSIFNEHANHLGPALADIAGEKAAIAATARRTIVSAQAADALRRCGFAQEEAFLRENDAPLRPNLPLWLAIDDRLARQAIASVLPVDDAALLSFDVNGVSTAWGSLQYLGVEVVFDALINLESLDRAWFERTFAEKTLILFSLPDDKDRRRLAGFVEALPNAASAEIVLTGKRGYLSYEEAEKRPDRVCSRIRYDDAAAFRRVLTEQIARHTPSKIYCFGTHTYVRLVKSALGPASTGA